MEKVVREVRGRQTLEEEIMVNSPLHDDTDARKTITIKCNLTLV